MNGTKKSYHRAIRHGARVSVLRLLEKLLATTSFSELEHGCGQWGDTTTMPPVLPVRGLRHER